MILPIYIFFLNQNEEHLGFSIMNMQMLRNKLISLFVRRRVSSVVEHLFADPKVPGLIPGRSHTGVMDYDEACFMHLTPGVVHNFPKAVGV